MNKYKKFCLTFIGAGCLSLVSTSSFAARCDYIIQNEWNSGFVANIRITNDTTTAINDWSVNWAYADGTERTGGWNANVSGNNPYTAVGVNWNSTIQPGQYIEFGIRGNKGVKNTPAASPKVTGAVCGSGASNNSNTAPIANLKLTQKGPTVFFDARGSVDADGDALTYSLTYGDGESIAYDHAWHSFKEAKTYTAELIVSDGEATTSIQKTFTIKTLAATNRAPIAMLTAVRSRNAISARASASFDEDFDPLTFSWDFGDGEFVGSSAASVTDCAAGETTSKSRLVTLTVSDGNLADTVQRRAGGLCGTFQDVVPVAEFSYSLNGNTIRVDARDTRNTTALAWDFGDGFADNGLIATHVYANPGTYNVTLRASGPTLFGNSIVKKVEVGSTVSSPSSRSSNSSKSSNSSSVVPPSSTSRSASSLSCPQGNSWPDCPISTWSDSYCQAHSKICIRSSSSVSSRSSLRSSVYTSSRASL